MRSEDLYAVLGILPDAEEVVVVAAYRALTMRYHPDRWVGDSAEAHRRMSQINAAYEILGNKLRRAEYDRSRQGSNRAEFASEEEAGQTEAFTTALKDVEHRWAIACSIYNDLNQHRQRLCRISTSLAFSYVVGLVESKAYAKRVDIAVQMERKFLERFFGENDTIIEYAGRLILSGHKQAAKALNAMVDVVGSEADPHLLISRIDQDFDLGVTRERTSREAARKAYIQALVMRVQALNDYKSAQTLAHTVGYSAQEIGGGFFSDPEILVITPADESLMFKNPMAFVFWVQQTICTKA